MKNTYPEKIQDLVPEDTRHGDGIVLPPMGGEVTPEYKAELEEKRTEILETIRNLEDKYPEFRWWEKGFVDENPTIALLMQSLNDESGFQSPADYMRLHEKVLKKIKDEAPIEGDIPLLPSGTEERIGNISTQVALNRLNHMGEHGHALLEEAVSHMTDQDKEDLRRQAATSE